MVMTVLMALAMPEQLLCVRCGTKCMRALFGLVLAIVSPICG